MNVSLVERSVRSIGLSSRPATLGVSVSATISLSPPPSLTAVASGLMVGVAGESDMGDPSNPMLGVGIIRLDSCGVNHSLRGFDKVRSTEGAQTPAGWIIYAITASMEPQT